MTRKETDRAIQAYIEAALWTSTDEEGETFESLNFDAQDIEGKSIANMAADVEDFVSANEEKLDESGLEPEQIGQDFWLTRNRHGAGFWDRGLGKVGRELSDAAHVYGSSDLYIGDDEKLHTT